MRERATINPHVLWQMDSLSMIGLSHVLLGRWSSPPSIMVQIPILRIPFHSGGMTTQHESRKQLYHGETEFTWPFQCLFQHGRGIEVRTQVGNTQFFFKV